MSLKKKLVILPVTLFIVSLTVALTTANQQQYSKGFKDDCRDGYKDEFRESKVDSKKTYSTFIKGPVTKNDYDRGYERGYSDCSPRGYAAGLRIK